MSVRILHGDMLAELSKLIAAGERFHACVTDPPYHLTSGNMAVDWASYQAEKRSTNKSGRGHKVGFMGKVWDGGDIAFRPETWRLVFDALLPGAHMLCCGGTRTFHRMACSIEDAGFEIRDTLCWLYGQGFSKVGYIKNGDGSHVMDGWAGSLKPAFEPIILARKPLGQPTVAANVLRYGTGALNIDASRVACDQNPSIDRRESAANSGKAGRHTSGDATDTNRFRANADPAVALERYLSRGDSEHLGRWPANVLHDGSDEVLTAFPESEDGVAGKRNAGVGMFDLGAHKKWGGYGGSGSAARFFWSAKADAADRCGSNHPTVKPTDLIRYLVRLITPPGGCVLDPFAGTGTTGLAADQLGFDAVLIEQDTTYAEDARRKIMSDAPLLAQVAAE